MMDDVFVDSTCSSRQSTIIGWHSDVVPIDTHVPILYAAGTYGLDGFVLQHYRGRDCQ